MESKGVLENYSPPESFRSSEMFGGEQRKSRLGDGLRDNSQRVWDVWVLFPKSKMAKGGRQSQSTKNGLKIE